jgi:tetratricopeptide (TPR) repeat protein/transglutaminase-like putative cysteine protease/ketosteroid isomerase-like protein
VYRPQAIAFAAILMVLGYHAGCGAELPIAARPLPPAPWPDLVNDANTHISVGAYASAISLLEQSLDIRPDEPDVLYKLGELLSSMGDHDGARRYLSASLALSDDITVRNYLGFVEESAGSHAAAAAQFERVITTEPQNLYALAHLGLAYTQSGRLNEAFAALEAAHGLDPTRASPDTADLDFYLGLAYESAGRLPDAVEAYARLVLAAPTDRRPYMRLGAIHERLDDLPGAKKQFEHAYALDAADEEARAQVERLAALIQDGSQETVDAVPAVRILPDDVADRVLTAPGLEEYPGHDAVVLLSRSEHEITPTGRTRFSTRQVVKLLHRRAFGAYGEVAIPYNSSSQNIGVNIARAVLPDGTVVPVGPDSIHDVTPPEALTFNLYSDSLWKVISFPALAEGVILEYQVTVEDKVGRGNTNNLWFWGAMTFQGPHPTLASQYALRTPNGVPFVWKAYQCELQAKISPEPDDSGMVQGPEITYTWEYGATPAQRPEPNGPPANDLLPRLAFSSVEDWDTLHDWYRSLLTDRTTLDGRVSEAVAEAVDGAVDHTARLRALAQFVATETRYVAIQLGQGQFQPHPAADVLRHRYGDCKDKCALLMTMFQAVGVKALPALINPSYAGSDVDIDLPSLGQFSHMILAVPDASSPGGYAWVDPTDDTMPYGRLPASDQGRTAMLITDDAPVWVQTPVDGADTNRYDWTLTLGADDDGAVYGSENLTATGTHASDVRRAYQAVPPTGLPEYLRSLMSPEYPGVIVDNAQIAGMDDLAEPFAITADFSLRAYGTKTDDTWTVPIPSAGLSAYAAMVVEPERAEPIVLGVPNALTRTVSLELPDGFEAELQEPLLLQTEFASLSRELVAEGSTVVYEMQLVIRQHTVPAERYGAVRAVFEALAREEDAAILLRRAPAQPRAAASPQDAAELLDRWRAAWVAGDGEALLALYDDGAVVHRVATHATPDPMVGIEELSAHLEHLDRLYERVEVEVENVAVTRTSEASATVTFDQTFRGYARAGDTRARYADRGAKTVQIANGLIVQESWTAGADHDTGGPFYLQVASFRRQARARSLMDTLGPGARLESARLATGLWHRVVVGSYRSAALAANAAQSIQAISGAAPIVRRITSRVD